LLRGGERLAEGPVSQILTREWLEALYGTPVQMITDKTGRAFIPG
jgi:iron complex transport system ATP-binding protein